MITIFNLIYTHKPAVLSCVTSGSDSIELGNLSDDLVVTKVPFVLFPIGNTEITRTFFVAEVTYGTKFESPVPWSAKSLAYLHVEIPHLDICP